MGHGLYLEREHGAASMGDDEDLAAVVLDPGGPVIHSPQMTTGTGPQQRMRATWVHLELRKHG